MARPPVPQEPVVLPPYTVLVQPLIGLRDAFDEPHYQKKVFVWDIRSPVLVRMVPYYTFLSAKLSTAITRNSLPEKSRTASSAAKASLQY